jgi:hypothetical protein
MRKFFSILCVLFLAAPLVAQVSTGNIVGTVVDEDGNPIPGVNVTLTGSKTGMMTAVTTGTGAFRFPALAPANDYDIKLELEGFQTKIEAGVIVAVNRTTDVVFTMELGAIEESITVTATTPVVDVKKTSISATVDYQTMQSLPTARDPWVILQMTPAVQVDRENVGGSESGQQSNYAILGGTRSQATWTFDGVNITDPAARGASPSYFDFDVFEEMNVTVGGADVETMTGGVALNLVTRRGGNRLSLGGRFYWVDERFQATPSGDLYEELKDIFGEKNGYSQIRDIKDFGFNIGGPLIADKVWLWGSYGVQQIQTNIITGAPDDTYLNNYAFKANIQIIPENRFEFFYHAGAKKKFGRSSSTTYPFGWNQGGKYHFGSPIMKFQDEHMFGDNLFVSAKYTFSDAGFGMWPAHDMELTDISKWDVDNAIDIGSYSWFFTYRPNKQVVVHATYYNDTLFGASHEFKAGLEWLNKKNGDSEGYPGNIQYNFNYNTETVDWDGDGTRDIVRDDFGIDLRRLWLLRGDTDDGPGVCNAYTAFLRDTVTFGALTLKIGLRFDSQQPYTQGGTYDSIFTTDSDQVFFENYYDIQQQYLGPATAAAFNQLMPGTVIPPSQFDARGGTHINWNYISPRLGLTWDLTGDGKTIGKLSYSSYQEVMGSYHGYFWERSGSSGQINFYWHDANGNDVADLSELYWSDYSQTNRPAYRAFDDNGNFVGNWDREENLHWSGYDPYNPTETAEPRYYMDPDWHGHRTYEVIASLERELTTDFGVALDFSWRKYNSWRTWRRFATEKGGRLIERSDYIPGYEPIPSSHPEFDVGEAAGRDYYVWAPGILNIYQRYITNTPDDYQRRYWSLAFRANKRLSNNWMLSGSFTYQLQTLHYGAQWPLNPSEQWAEDGEIYAYSMGASSGKISMPIFARWMVKAQGMYQFTSGTNLSMTFNAREGHLLPHHFDISDNRNPNPYSTSYSNYATEISGSSRLPVFWNLNLRLEQMLRVGDMGRIYLMVDCFNVFNNNILNRQRAVDNGRLYMHSGNFSAASRSGEYNEVLNPRTFRFGLRFQF